MYKKRCDSAVFRPISKLLANRNSKACKKGQVTVFIIIGILLLLILILLIVFRNEIFTPTPEEITPAEKGSVTSFVSSCLEEIGAEALTRVGLQGGYVIVPEDLLNDGGVTLKTSPVIAIPYWAYGEQTNIPTLDQIERRIDEYIQENLRECVFSQQAFQETYDVEEKSIVVSNTQVLDSRVQFNVNWELEIRDKAGVIVSELLTHQADSPIKLKRVYEVATKIVDQELSDLKLEDITQDLLALEHENVPLAGFEVGCTQKKWQVAKVKETIQDLLRVNIAQLKVSGTNYVDFPDDFSYYQNHYIWNMGQGFVVQDVSVLFAYQNSYPFEFEVTPKNGAYLTSNSIGGNNPLLSAVCMQNWKFVYSLSFPVVVTIEDETTGYKFKTAFTVHLKHNFPNRAEAVLSHNPFYRTTTTDEAFCQTKTVPMTVETYELVENNLTGVYNREPLDDVDLLFTCLRYSCDVGKTSYQFQNSGNVASNAELYPFCAGGIIRASKEGYKDAWQRVITRANQRTELDLVPILKVPVENINVVTHEFDPKNPFVLGPARALTEEQTAVITLTNSEITPTADNPLHEITFVKSQNIDSRILADQTADFLAKADYTYDLEINVLNNEELLGGYKGNFTALWSDLTNGKTITLHTIIQSDASEDERFELFLGLSEASKYAPPPSIKQ